LVGTFFYVTLPYLLLIRRVDTIIVNENKIKVCRKNLRAKATKSMKKQISKALKEIEYRRRPREIMPVTNNGNKLKS
jgi:hypothetical protein